MAPSSRLSSAMSYWNACELVPEYVVGFFERPEHRHHDSPAQSLGDATGAFADAGHDVGLTEVRARRVEDEGLQTRQLVRESATGARTSAPPSVRFLQRRRAPR